MDTATDFLFGESVQSQAAFMLKSKNANGNTIGLEGMAQQASSAQFAEDFEAMGVGVQRRIQLQSLYWLAGDAKFRRAIANAHDFIEHYVQRAIDEREKPQASKKEYLLSALANQTQDRTKLRIQALAILFAGRDTTAALLGWCTIRVALHPDIGAQLRKDVVEHFGSRSEKLLTFSQLKACRPLQHFINEVLRPNTVVPFNARVATRDTTLPCGGGPDRSSPVAVRDGTDILYSVYVMHRRKDLWGDDALEFRPSRWEDKPKSAWQFLPFNGGPRICLGQQFAIVETSYVLVRLLQRYERVEAVERSQMAKMRKGIGSAMWPADGVKVRWQKI